MKVKKLNCPNCSAKIKKGQTSCEYCGTMLDFEENANTISTPTIPQNPQPTTPIEDLTTISTPDDSTPNTDEITELPQITEELTAQRKIREKKHRIVSCIVSAIVGIAAIASGIILIDRVSYIGIALVVFGILRLCKIFYTFMRSSYNMTPAGYTYSGIICAVISGLGIYGGVELLRVSPTLDGKLICIIPFIVAAVSITYFITKTFYFIRDRKAK